MTRGWPWCRKTASWNRPTSTYFPLPSLSSSSWQRRVQGISQLSRVAWAGVLACPCFLCSPNDTGIGVPLPMPPTPIPVALFYVRDFYRGALVRAELRRGQDLLSFVGIFKIRQGDDRLFAGELGEDVGGLIDKSVLVADHVGVGPPGGGVGMIAAVGGHDLRPA